MKKIFCTLMLLLSLGSTLCIEQVAADNQFFSIHNDTEWYEFQQAVAQSKGQYRVDARLEADFSTTGGIGIGSDTPYCGTFDGNGHTLDVNIWRNDGNPCALFCYVKDATITDLHVKGTITGGLHSGGLIGRVIGSPTVSIDRVWVSTTVNASSTSHAGGVIGHTDNAAVYMTDCRYDGKVITNNADPESYSGQIIGWANNGGLWRLKRVYDCGLGPDAHWKFVCMWHNGNDWQSWGTGGGSYVVTQHGWTNADAWDKTNQSEVVNLMNARRSGSWELVDGKAVPKIYKKSSVNDLIYLSQGSSSGYLLSSGHYYVTQNITFSNDDGAKAADGLTIADGATVHIYIPAGVTLTASGGGASGMTGGGAGILLPQNSTLYLKGKGKVVAQGGNAANGRNGSKGNNASQGSGIYAGKGGDGGNGGGGAGAGIGTSGGSGGAGGSGAGTSWNNGSWTDVQGVDGNSGTAGGSAAAMGTLYVDNTFGLDLTANGGSQGTSGGAGGAYSDGAAAHPGNNLYLAGGGGGGGGGGFGGSAYAIGSGGCGGGGGGGGAAGNVTFTWYSGTANDYHHAGADGGSGGKNGDGSNAASGGSKEIGNPYDATDRAGNLRSDRDDYGDDGGWDTNNPCHPGGSGGDRGNSSTGLSVNNLHDYILNLKVLNEAGSSTAQQTKTITYRSNKSSGNATVTIPTTYQLGLIESDKYVTKWYTSNGCSGNDWKAAYDEKEISCGPTDLYGVWQNYTDLFQHGTGTQGNPFIIEDDGLLDLANYVNAGGNTRGLYFKQNGEIDLSVIQPSGGWTPIGHKRVFEGDYDGDGNRIIKATNTSCNYDAFGIFGKVSGSIHNLGVEGCNLQTTRSNSRAGGIAGMLLRCDMEQATTAQIRDCYAVGNTITATYTGGLVGEMTNASTISYALETRSTLHHNFGGIVCLISNDCQMNKCFTSGSLSANGYLLHTNSVEYLSYERLKSGEITWLLNNQSPYGVVWFQNLGTDDYPLLNNQHERVYYNAENYTNTGNGPLFDNLSGHGTAKDPFLINNVSDFELVASFCNSGNNTSGFYFLQTADFDLNGGGLTPIGTSKAFAGIYDGGGHTIRNGYIETGGVVGVFAVVSGTVTRLCVENTTVKYTEEGMRAGGIAARLTGNGVISNCLVKGCTIANNGHSGVVGGIASDMFDQSVIKNCLVVNTSLTASRTGSICSDTKAGTRIERSYSDSNPRVSEAYGTFVKCETVGSDALGSGEICWSLNNETESLSPAWFQTISIEGHKDATPVLSSDHAIVFYNNGCTNDYRGISSLANTNSQSPAGSQQNPYRVGSAADLKKISDTFEAMRYSNYYIVQTADIDMKEAEPIAPIGVGTSGFTGHYDGGGYVIKNLSFTECKGITRENIYDTAPKSLGLFNNIIGTVERLGIETSTFRAKDNVNRVGAFAGKITDSGQLLNCYAWGCTVSYNYKSGVVVGALAGELTDQAKIQRCYGYKNTVVGQNDGGSKRYGYIVGDIGSNASATLVFTNGPTLCADGQSGFSNITSSEMNVAEQHFNSGEVTHLLDGSPEYQGTQESGTSIWRQNINKTANAQTDLVPVLNSSHKSVYKMSWVTQTMYTNAYVVPTMSTLSLDPNYKDNQGADVPATVVSVFPADDNYYVPSYHLEYSIPTRNYFYFTGWNTQADGKGTHYAPNDEVLPFTSAKTLYAEWDMTVPSDGTSLDVALPTGKTSFKIYDAAGNNTPYGSDYSGKITLTAPESHVIVLTGTVSTEALVGGQACDYMIVRNGSTSSAIMSNGESTEISGVGHVFASTTNGTEKSIGRLVSTGTEMTIEFYSNGQNNFNGLNLTATVFATSISELGQGTAENPFEVEFVEDLETVKNYFQLAQRTDFYIKQIEDIDLKGATVSPLDADYESFAGHYDGQGYTIKNGTITSTGTKVGFFANVTGTVTRLCMDNITVSYQHTHDEEGAIAGHLGSTGRITNCRVNNITLTRTNFETSGYRGAIVGMMDDGAAITNCLVMNTDNVYDFSYNKSIGANEHCYMVTATDAFDLQRGKICYLLNGSSSTNAIWRQEIGTDSAPVLDGPAHSESPIVYYYDEQGHQGYTNEETASLVTLRVQDVPFNTLTDHEAIKGSMVRLADYAPQHDNLQLIKWNTDANGTGTQYVADATLVLSEEALVLYPLWDKMPTLLPGEGTENSPYIIASADDWNALATNIAYFNSSFNGYVNKHIRLDADIDVSEMVGTSANNTFRGTFNGNSHTLTFTKGTASQAFTEQFCAPFRYVYGCTIKNLKTAGDIYTSNNFASGIIGRASGTVTITNCHVSTVIHSSIKGNGSHGGIVANANQTTNITGCVYDGRLFTTNSTTLCGGFVGWYANSKVNVTNSLYAPNPSITPATGETAINDGNTFVRSGGNIINSYYTETMGIAQGKQPLTVTAGDKVTISDIGLVGSSTATYNVSGITAYASGINYGNTVYYGEDDQVSLTLSNSNDRTQFIVKYQASEGTLTGSENPYTLTMPANNVTINALLMPILATDGNGNYLINDASDWGSFVDCIASGNVAGFNGKVVKLTNDIEVTTMAGMGNYTFRGTFDGDGHTLTVNYTTSEQYAAPFHYTHACTIKNLKVAGVINTSSQNAGGVVGRCTSATIKLINVSSSVTINSSYDGSGYHGGLVGYAINASFEGCAFTGKLLGDNSNHWGGLLGQKSDTNGSNASFTDCLFAPSEVAVNTDWSFPFANGASQYATFTNCYFTKMLSNAQGAQAKSFTSAPVNLGNSVQNYGIVKAYDNGILFDGDYYVAPAMIELTNNADDNSTTITDADGYFAYPNFDALNFFQKSCI